MLESVGFCILSQLSLVSILIRKVVLSLPTDLNFLGGGPRERTGGTLPGRARQEAGQDGAGERLAEETSQAEPDHLRRSGRFLLLADIPQPQIQSSRFEPAENI